MGGGSQAEGGRGKNAGNCKDQWGIHLQFIFFVCDDQWTYFWLKENKHSRKNNFCSKIILIYILCIEYDIFNNNMNISHHFFNTKSPLRIHNTSTQIQKVILFSKTGFK